MLQHETLEVETSAAHIRVTPQELAQATAAIEARQDVRAQQEASTIPIGEAVQQLNLNATPEEVLAEVQALRAKAQQVATRPTVGLSRKQVIRVLFAIIAPFAFAFLLLWVCFGHLSSTPSGTQMVSPAAPVRATPHASSMLLQQLNSGFRSLDIAEGQTISCKFANLEALAQGKSASELYTAVKPGGTTWHLLKKDGRFFVNCWTTKAYAEDLINGRTGVVYADKTSGLDEKPDTPIVLPVEQFINTTTHINTDAPAAVVINANGS